MKSSLAVGLVLLCLCLVGCEKINEYMDWMAGIKRNVVVLAASPLTISPAGMSFIPSSSAVVVGENPSVCFVMASGVFGKDTELEVERLLNGAELSAAVTFRNGVTRDFKLQGVSWARRGRVLATHEVAACVYANYANCANSNYAEQVVSIGSIVQSVRVSSTAPLQVQGLFWTSTSSYD